MLDEFIDSPNIVQRLRSGSLGAHLDSFAKYLATSGYAAASARSQLTLLGQPDQWMARRRCGLSELSDEAVDRFVIGGASGDLRKERPRRCITFSVISGRMAFSRRWQPVLDETPVGRLQQQYERYLVLERGLAAATVTGYRDTFRRFFSERFGQGPMNLCDLDVSTVTRFMVRHAPTMSPARAKLMGTALRSIFQFLLQRGAIDRDLAACVPPASDWRLAPIPEYLSTEEVERLLQACDHQTATGRRDRAILLLLRGSGTISARRAPACFRADAVGR
jgi:hypothetical protein